MKRQKILIEDWINKEGVEKIAKLMEVDPSTVRHWRRGHCLPRTEQMKLIKDLTKGRCGYAQIIDRELK